MSTVIDMQRGRFQAAISNYQKLHREAPADFTRRADGEYEDVNIQAAWVVWNMSRDETRREMGPIIDNSNALRAAATLKMKVDFRFGTIEYPGGSLDYAPFGLDDHVAAIHQVVTRMGTTQ